MQLSVLPIPAASHFDTGPRSISAVRVLRISITDRCNFRCLYCMPEDGVPWLPKEQILTFNEIADVVRAAINLHNIRRFKLTGGEPTLRPNLLELVKLLRAIPGVEDLSLTTNGMLLESLAAPLRQAGLDRLTISLDSLNPARFKQITRTGDLPTVLNGLACAVKQNFSSIKLNVVAMRGVNDDEFPEFARLTLHQNLTVRFIEYMPLGDSQLTHTSDSLQSPGDKTSYPPSVNPSEIGPAAGCGSQLRGDVFIPEPEIRSKIEHSLGPLTPMPRQLEPGVGPATIYQLAHNNPAGRIGFISAMSAPFCETCNRLRLTADGILRSCLFDGGTIDIRPILRSHLPPNQLQQSLANAMTDCVRLKPLVHSAHGNEQMSRLGG